VNGICSQFSSYEEAYHQLLIDLVTIQHECIRLTEGTHSIEDVIVTGGFGNNEFFPEAACSETTWQKEYTLQQCRMQLQLGRQW
jgi:hypothetical protein